MMKQKPYFQLHSDKDLVSINFGLISGLSIPNFIDKNNLTMHLMVLLHGEVLGRKPPYLIGERMQKSMAIGSHNGAS